jgi:RimJ/RimL family protein N-acetyltransferase
VTVGAGPIARPSAGARRDPPTLGTARLVLRPLVASDTAAIAALAGDPAVAFHLDRVPSPFPPALAARWIARRALRWRERRGVTLAITVPAGAGTVPPLSGGSGYAVAGTRAPDPGLVGTVSLRISAAHRHAELGYWVAAPAWGAGIATEAAAALVDWGFTALGLHRVHVRVLADNPGSRRVADKLGLAVEGVRPGHYRRGREFLDVIELGIARDAWLTAARPLPPPSPPPRRRRRRPRRSCPSSSSRRRRRARWRARSGSRRAAS